MFARAKSTALVPVDSVDANLTFVVRRDRRIVAAFAKRSHAVEWAQMRSFTDESEFSIHTAGRVLEIFRDGEELAP